MHVQNISPYKQHSQQGTSFSKKRESQSFLPPETACIATIRGQNLFGLLCGTTKEVPEKQILLVLKWALHQIVKICWFKRKDQSSFLLAFCPPYYQLRTLCTLSGVRHSAPGILSFFFWWHSEGSQSPGDKSKYGITQRFPQWDSKAFPWGRDKKDACGRICLSLRDVVVEKRIDKDRQAVRCVLLPASQILQDSVNLLFFAESLKERQQVQELRVIHVVEPGLDWNLGAQGNHVQQNG